jgi:hypothetical protein
MGKMVGARARAGIFDKLEPVITVCFNMLLKDFNIMVL